MRLLSFAHLLKHKPTQFVAALAVAFIGLFAVAGLQPHHAAAACSNDIICGGFSSRSEFIKDVKGSSELQHIYGYSAYGLSASLYDNFQSSAQSGYTTRDGNIYLNNGTKVGSGATSIGRLASYQGSGYFKQVISGAGTYYGNVNDKAFAAGTSRLSVDILLNSDGQAIFVVITSCGNPVHFTPTPPPAKPKPAPTPSYSCVQLTGAIIDKSANTYQLTVRAAYANGAKPVSADFNFGNGQKQSGVTLTGTTASVSYSYPSTNASYTASAVLHFIVNGKAVTSSSNACQTTIATTIPYCQGLTGAIIDASKYQAQFTATGVLNGRTLESADFNFGDGQVQNGVTPSGTNTVTVTHNYATGGSYNALATLHFSASGQTYTAPTCRALVSPQTIVSECKPGVPVGDIRCQNCQYDTTLPADSPQCQPPCTDTGDTSNGAVPCTTPPALPNTGAGNTIAIFSAVVVGGFIVYRQFIYRRHKAAFAAAQYGTSALPLADPINPDSPLDGTPLAQSRRRSFRRRQY